MKALVNESGRNGHTMNTTDQKDVILLLNTAFATLRSYEDELNRLNVYPVPDGDTGTNMVQTMQSVIQEAAKVDGNSLSTIAPAITYGSLMGARGNSGVILSQIVRGVCEVLENTEDITSEVLTKALVNASTVAYAAVKKPVEGTMLTVIRDMANAAAGLSGNGIDPLKLLEYVLEEGRRSVERTPTLLPVLKEAGVVDAGGYGLVVLTQGIVSALKGERPAISVSEDQGQITVVDEDITFMYCTEFILKSDGINLTKLEKILEKYGDSLLVVGTKELTKIHIHTNKPGKILNIATALGSISQVDINNIVEQSAERAKAIKAESEDIDLSELLQKQEKEIGVVAVANGDGVKKILLSLGVDRVINGGQSMNPSAAQIVAAVNDAPAKHVFILPNNKNIILTANQAEALTDKSITVIPTRSIPEAFAALTAYEPDGSVEDNAGDMEESISHIKTGELTTAIRDDSVGAFKKGDYIGLHDGSIKTSGTNFIKTSVSLIKAMIDEDDEIITVLVGKDVNEKSAEALRQRLAKDFRAYDIDFHRGDQPIYHVIIGIE